MWQFYINSTNNTIGLNISLYAFVIDKQYKNTHYFNNNLKLFNITFITIFGEFLRSIYGNIIMEKV